MLAFIGNLSVLETVVILVVAVLIFGKDLPQVAGKVYVQVRKLRRSFDDMRRETGIDREIRNIESTFRDVADEAKVEPSVPHTQARQQLLRRQEDALAKKKAEGVREVTAEPASAEPTSDSEPTKAGPGEATESPESEATDRPTSGQS